jgi:hypothetical protein
MGISVISEHKLGLQYSRQSTPKKAHQKKYTKIYLGISFLHWKSQSTKIVREQSRSELSSVNSIVVAVLLDGAFDENI